MASLLIQTKKNKENVKKGKFLGSIIVCKINIAKVYFSLYCTDWPVTYSKWIRNNSKFDFLIPLFLILSPHYSALHHEKFHWWNIPVVAQSIHTIWESTCWWKDQKQRNKKIKFGIIANSLRVSHRPVKTV